MVTPISLVATEDELEPIDVGQYMGLVGVIEEACASFNTTVVLLTVLALVPLTGDDVHVMFTEQ